MDITNIIALLGAMSLSVERIVEIIKQMIPFLTTTQTDEKKERYRRAAIQILSVLAGMLIALVAQEQIQPLISHIFPKKGEIGFVGCIILGFLASGGSGFWNQAMAIVEETRKAKKGLRMQTIQKAQ